ncbi:MAG: hypothetical protein ACLR9Z_11760 [Alitiscatomonas sp.]
MKLTKAELSDKEKALADLLAPVGSSRLFDFTVDETIRQITVTTYELKNGQWDHFTSNSTPLSSSQGLLFLGFENIPDGIRTGIQIDEKNSVTQWEPFESTEESSAPAACVTRQLEQPADIIPEKEIPVILQILDSGGTIETLDLDFFHDPSRAEGYGYDRVFCITVSFSQTPLR